MKLVFVVFKQIYKTNIYNNINFWIWYCLLMSFLSFTLDVSRIPLLNLKFPLVFNYIIQKRGKEMDNVITRKRRKDKEIGRKCEREREGMRIHGANQVFRFVEGIWLHSKSSQIRFFLGTNCFSLHVCNMFWANILYKYHC